MLHFFFFKIATVGLYRNSKLTIGHVGDSRAVLCHEGLGLVLTQDHRPALKNERQRIEEAGGRVINNRFIFLKKRTKG